MQGSLSKGSLIKPKKKKMDSTIQPFKYFNL